MSLEENWKYLESVHQSRKVGDNEDAGRYYTLSAYEIVGHSELARRDYLSMGIVRLLKLDIVTTTKTTSECT